MFLQLLCSGAVSICLCLLCFASCASPVVSAEPECWLVARSEQKPRCAAWRFECLPSRQNCKYALIWAYNSVHILWDRCFLLLSFWASACLWGLGRVMGATIGCVQSAAVLSCFCPAFVLTNARFFVVFESTLRCGNGFFRYEQHSNSQVGWRLALYRI